MSQQLVDHLRSTWDTDSFRVLNVTVSTSNARKERFELGKLIQLVRVALALSVAARRSTTVYLLLAQNTVGLLRDAVLIAVARLARVHIVVHLHGGALADNALPRPLIAMLRRLLDGQSGIVLAESLRRHLEYLMPNARTIVAIPSGVWIPDSVPPLPIAERHQDGPLTLGYLSTLREEKGYRVIVEAAARVNAASSSSRIALRLVGPVASARDAAWIERAARLHPWLTYVGPVSHDEITRELLQFDLVALTPFWQEGAPLSILEAMAWGRAVLVSPSGALVEMVGEHGWVVQPNIDSIAQAFEDALGDRDTVLERGGLLRQRCKEFYNLTSWLNDMSTFLLETLHQHATHR